MFFSSSQCRCAMQFFVVQLLKKFDKRLRNNCTFCCLKLPKFVNWLGDHLSHWIIIFLKTYSTI
jgi:hypothetical protein